MFYVFLGIFLLIWFFSFIVIAFRIRKFKFIQCINPKNAPLITIALVLLIFFSIWTKLVNIYTVTVIILHLAVIWLICDFVAFIIKKLRKEDFKRYYAGGFAILLTVIYLSFGWFFAHHIYRTDYTVYTSKNLGRKSIRVVEIADVHLGATLNGDEFAKETEKIQKLNPDIVIIAGDFVDNDSKKSDFKNAYKALDELKTTYGVYYIYGNHDESFGFTHKLRKELQKYNIKILEDEKVLINNSLYLIGRNDKSYKSRKDMQTLTADLDKSKYMLVADHQPNDYKAQEKSGVDLVISGHTHGGHMFPAGYIGLISGANDKIYGLEKRNNTTFIVSSGISGWAIPFKTGAISEFVVIDIKQK